MTTQHTPGPWRIGGWDGYDYNLPPDPDLNDPDVYRRTHAAYPAIFGANGNRICNVDSHKDEDRNANAQLIAAAPDLLAACQLLLPYGDHYRYKTGEPNPYDVLKAAIAKATQPEV